jgi:hypothetical protein
VRSVDNEVAEEVVRMRRCLLLCVPALVLTLGLFAVHAGAQPAAPTPMPRPVPAEDRVGNRRHYDTARPREADW